MTRAKPKVRKPKKLTTKQRLDKIEAWQKKCEKFVNRIAMFVELK